MCSIIILKIENNFIIYSLLFIVNILNTKLQHKKMDYFLNKPFKSIQKYAYYDACDKNIKLVNIDPEEYSDVLQTIDRILMFDPVISVSMLITRYGEIFEKFLPFDLGNLLNEYVMFYELNKVYIKKKDDVNYDNDILKEYPVFVPIEVKLDDLQEKYPGIIDMEFYNLKLNLTDEPSLLYLQQTNEPNYKVIQHLILLYLSHGKPSYTFNEDVLRDYFSKRDRNYAIFLMKLFLKEIFIAYNSKGYPSKMFFFMPIIDIWLSHEYKEVINSLVYHTRKGKINRVCSEFILIHLCDIRSIDHVLRYFDRLLFNKDLFE